jgi:hypothetical protein
MYLRPMRLSLLSLFFILLAIPLTGIAQNDTLNSNSDVELVQGYVVHVRDSTPIAGAHIVDRDFGKIANTNSVGAFTIQARKGDSIFVTAIGYDLVRMAYQGGDDFLVVTLTPRSYKVDEVSVFPFPTPQHFKQAFLTLEVPNNFKPVDPPPVMRRTEVLSAPEGGFGVNIAGPITALYNLVSKEGKERRKMRRVLEEERYAQALEAQFSKELVMSITGLPEDKVRGFLDYCEALESFRTLVKDDSFVSAVTECYVDFAGE